MITEHLTNFIRHCHKDEELWVYGQIKKLLAIPLLPKENIKESYNFIKQTILDVMENKINGFQKANFEKFFNYISRNYFENEDKITKICKFDKTIRTTNLIESVHSSFKKSRLTFQNGCVNNCVNGKFSL